MSWLLLCIPLQWYHFLTAVRREKPKEKKFGGCGVPSERAVPIRITPSKFSQLLFPKKLLLVISSQPGEQAGSPGTPKRKLMLLCLCVVERWGRKRVERTGGAVKANGEMQGWESRPDHA